MKNSDTKPFLSTKKLAEDCAREIMDTIPWMLRFIRTEIRRKGKQTLSVPQLRTLFFLSYSPGSDLSSVADHLGVTLPTASAMANRLVHDGLMDRKINPHQRRCRILTLTRRGNQRVQKTYKLISSLLVRELSDFRPEELFRVTESLALLGKKFKKTKNEVS